MPDLVFAARPPAEALDYMKSKAVGGRFAFDHRDAEREEHVNAFMVAKAMTADVLTDIHSGLVASAEAGTTREQFAAELTPLLQAKGWWGKQEGTDPLTGEVRLVQLGSPRRLETIFNVNMRQAYAAGRWERAQADKATLPFMRYVAVQDGRTRPEHSAWHGVCLPVDDPWWDSHYPPCDFGCRCTTQSINQRTMDRRGFTVTETPPQFPPKAYRNPRTGEVRVVERGIAPGFDYNVGKARLANFVAPSMEAPQRPGVIGPRIPAALPEVQPRPLPADIQIRPDLAAAPAAVVFDAMGAKLGRREGEVFTDRAQVPVVVGVRMFERHDAAGRSTGDKANLFGRAEFAELLAATMRDPDEIWHSMQKRADGTSMLVRNYVAAFDGGASGRFWFVVTFHDRDGVWWGATAFPPGRRGAPADQAIRTARGARVGTLVYRRK